MFPTLVPKNRDLKLPDLNNDNAKDNSRTSKRYYWTSVAFDLILAISLSSLALFSLLGGGLVLSWIVRVSLALLALSALIRAFFSFRLYNETKNPADAKESKLNVVLTLIAIATGLMFNINMGLIGTYASIIFLPLLLLEFGPRASTAIKKAFTGEFKLLRAIEFIAFFLAIVTLAIATTPGLAPIASLFGPAPLVSVYLTGVALVLFPIAIFLTQYNDKNDKKEDAQPHYEPHVGGASSSSTFGSVNDSFVVVKSNDKFAYNSYNAQKNSTDTSSQSVQQPATQQRKLTAEEQTIHKELDSITDQESFINFCSVKHPGLMKTITDVDPRLAEQLQKAINTKDEKQYFDFVDALNTNRVINVITIPEAWKNPACTFASSSNNTAL